jgi:hypothetical protein
MKKHTFKVLLITFVFVQNCFGQSNNRLPQDNANFSSVSSPNSGGFGTGESINVDNYTGKLSVGIPVYNYSSSSNGLGHSVGLSYNGGGVKVDDIASSVGINWNLNYGGSIVREIRGREDEFDGVASIPDLTTASMTDLKFITDSKGDSEFDKFYFDAGGTSGSFIIDNSGNIIFNQTTNIKVQRIFGTTTGNCPAITFKITLENGTIYYYDNFNCTKLDYLDDGTLTAYASTNWYLTKIVAPFSIAEILFEYEDYNLDVISSKSKMAYKPIGNYGSNSIFNNSKDVFLKSADKRIKKITYPDGTIIDFNYSSFERRDLRTDRALESIGISNGYNGYFLDMHYVYMKDNTESIYQNYAPYPVTEKEFDYRLYLKKVNKRKGLNELKGYEFNYYGNASQRLSNANNYGYSSNSGAGSYLGTLSSIKNPLGGSTSILFEPNEAHNPLLHESTGDLHSTINNIDHIISVPDITTPVFNNTTTNYSAFTTLSDVLPKPVNYNSFNNKVHYRISGQSTWVSNNCYASGSGVNQSVTLSIYTVAQSGINFAITNKQDISTTNGSAFFIDYYANVNDDVYIGILENPNNCLSDNTMFQINDIQFYYPKTDEYIGGLRVKEVKVHDNISSINDIITSYKYVGLDGYSSGVVVNRPIFNFPYIENYAPLNTTTNHTFPDYVANPSTYDSYHLVSSSAISNIPVNSLVNFDCKSNKAINTVHTTNGSYVGYARVEKYQGTYTNYLSKTVTDYLTYNDNLLPTNLSNANSFLPYAPVDLYDFAYGLPKKVEVFTKNGTLKGTTDYEYDIIKIEKNEVDLLSTKAILFRHPPISISDYALCNYYPLTGIALPKKVTKKEYFDNGQFLTNISENTYDLIKLTLTENKVTTSQGEPVVTKYKYAHDYNILGVINTLNSDKINIGPIVTEVWKGVSPKLLNTSVLKLKPTNAGIKFEKSYELKSNVAIAASAWGVFNNTQLLQQPSLLEEGGVIDAYDDFGNVIQTSNKGIKTSYLYDYNNHVKVATVRNAKIDEIAYTSFETDNNFGGWTFNGAWSATSTPGFTGKSKYLLHSGCNLEKVVGIGNSYFVTVWAEGAAPAVNYTINGVLGPIITNVVPEVLETHNGWTMYRYSIPGANKIKITTSLSVMIDELRLYPQSSAMETATFKPLSGFTSICDAFNKVIHTEYDDFGRVKLVRDIDNNILKKQEYTIQEQQ